MAEFLTTSEIVSAVERIIKEAKEKLVLVSPYIQMSRTLLERLQDAERMGVATTLVYGKVDLNPEQRELLGKLDRLSLYFSENLHAKCYFNEIHMVIGSMNLYEFSEKNNREMGLFITYGTDKKAFKGAIAEVESIINSAVKEQTASPAISPQKVPAVRGRVLAPSKNGLDAVALVDSFIAAKNTPAPSRAYKGRNQGYCIHCSTQIPLSADKPYCYSCWDEWDYKGGNPFINERTCHGCGRTWKSSMAKPLCKHCYNN